MMNQNQLGQNITRYRKEKGLSQEKVSEYIGVSRQAVTKWENNISRPSSDNLIELAQLFDITVDVLLYDNKSQNTSNTIKITTSKAPWTFLALSVTCIISYIVISSLLHMFHFETLICLFVICVPIQLFLHIYFSHAITHNSFIGMAGFDEKIDYNYVEVKKMLVHVDLHIGILSTVSVFLLCTINCIDLKIDWINPLLLVIYILNFITTILLHNYKAINTIYKNNDDKKRATRSIPITLIYLFLLFAGIGILFFLFESKNIENNTMPAIQLGGLFLLGVLAATIGFFIENNNIKKWTPDKTPYKVNKISIDSLSICLLLYGLMCII